MAAARILAIGEILWDIFDDAPRLGGAPLNFAAHARRMEHDAILASAVGADDLGGRARARIESLGLNTRFVRTAAGFPTGSASVQLGPGGQPAFHIHRPAAYDETALSSGDLDWLERWRPEWLYFGTLMFTADRPRHALGDLLRRLPGARRFYDVNLRPDSYSAELVRELLSRANVVKLNETEIGSVREIADLSSESVAAFCRDGADRFGWETVCVTLGERGCALWRAGEYVEAPGIPVKVADTVGSGDAFAAALLDGLARQARLTEIAEFANRVGAIVASRPGAIPDWTLEETAAGST